MYFKQLVKEDLGCASYLVGCTDAGVCAVVDPRLDMVEELLALTSAKGMCITTVIETHIHADHISGHREIARRTGAKICVHEASSVEYPHMNVCDGDELVLGVVKIRVVHTPGHRPEHISLAVSDTSRSDDPWLLLTGDSLFVGDVARPDLAVAGEEGASALYESIFDRLLHFEDGVEVYPGHVAGSLCGRGMNAKTSSTIGFERRHNSSITPRTRAAFIAEMNTNLPQRPPNMGNIVEHNRQNYILQSLVPHVLDIHAFQQEREESGAQVLDTRSPEAFGEGHIPGAIQVFLHGAAFATRVGFVVAPELRLLLVVENEHDFHEAATQLSVVGFDRVVGFLQGGISAWQEMQMPVQRLAQISVEQLHQRRLSMTILDVRDQSEWDEEHIEGAIHLPYYIIEQKLHELDRSRPLAVLCAGGQRSSIACSLLQKHGFTNLFNVVGGMSEWTKAGFERVEATTW